MKITFTGQESTFTKTAKGGYSTMNVSYVDERGANKSWKLISFANPKVFDTFKGATPNTVFEITTRKNDKDFTEWASAELVGPATTNNAPTPAGTKPASVSNYETRDERNARQRLIVRQSCLKNAIDVQVASGSAISLPELFSLAEDMVAWVFEAPGLYEEASLGEGDSE